MIRSATKEDVPTILEIFNDNILHSTAIYMYKEQTFEQRPSGLSKSKRKVSHYLYLRWMVK